MSAEGEKEEIFAGRTADLDQWQSRFRKRKGPKTKGISLTPFTDRGILQLGLQTTCPNCQFGNWHGLDTVSYRVACERCLNAYEFPQGNVLPNSKNFRYRVVGPFSVPDFARGAYGALLALRTIKRVGGGTGSPDLTYSTALDLWMDGKAVNENQDAEVDFVAFRARSDSDGAQGAIATQELYLGLAVPPFKFRTKKVKMTEAPTV